MSDLWKMVDGHLLSSSALRTERFPTFYPSAASTISEEDGSVIGSCLRENYYRCAGYDRSDPETAYMQYIFAAGKMWEEWIINQFKEIGLFLGNNIKFVDLQRYISGEVDLVIRDPEDISKKVIVEIKTWYGYEATKEICGSTKTSPSPKDSNLLQAFLYLGQFVGQIEKVVLLYKSRENDSRNQFDIEMVEIGGLHYPKITTFWDKGPYADKVYSYIDKRITLEGIYNRYEILMERLQSGTIPPGDFRHSYTDEEIINRFDNGLVSKTAYEKWTKDKNNFALGHWKCRLYCPYRSMCLEQKKEDGDL